MEVKHRVWSVCIAFSQLNIKLIFSMTWGSRIEVVQTDFLQCVQQTHIQDIEYNPSWQTRALPLLPQTRATRSKEFNDVTSSFNIVVEAQVSCEWVTAEQMYNTRKHLRSFIIWDIESVNSSNSGVNHVEFSPQNDTLHNIHVRAIPYTYDNATLLFYTD